MKIKVYKTDLELKNTVPFIVIKDSSDTSRIISYEITVGIFDKSSKTIKHLKDAGEFSDVGSTITGFFKVVEHTAKDLLCKLLNEDLAFELKESSIDELESQFGTSLPL